MILGNRKQVSNQIQRLLINCCLSECGTERESNVEISICTPMIDVEA